MASWDSKVPICHIYITYTSTHKLHHAGNPRKTQIMEKAQ